MKQNWKKLETPFTEDTAKDLRAGDLVLISGTLYTARDKAHERLCKMIKNGEKLPFDPMGNVLYYVGPAPTPPGKTIGSAGPTTSYRMDPFSETILSVGIKGMIGKGKRDDEQRGCYKNMEPFT